MRGLSVRCVCVLVAASSLAWCAPVVENGFFRLALRDGQLSVEFDSTGGGGYIDAGVRLGSFRELAAGEATVEDEAFHFRGAEYRSGIIATGGFDGIFDAGVDLPPGGSLGQSFTVQPGEGYLAGAWALLTCSGVADSAVTMRLRRDGPDGEVLASRRIEPLTQQGDEHLRVDPPLPPGTYYLEISEKHGGGYWWSRQADVYGAGQAFADGESLADVDRRFGYGLVDVGTMDWSARLDGPALRVEAQTREQAVEGAPGVLALSFPWQRDGYATDDPATTPFRHMFDDTGHFIPVEAFKRLETDWSLEPPGDWAHLHGTRDFDLRLVHARGRFEAQMDADGMHLLLGPGASVEVRAPDAEPPAYMPRFFTSDAAGDEKLNRFLQVFLFPHPGAMASPIGMEWDPLKLGWVAGPIHDSFGRVILHFTHRIDDDGYVWCRGESRGWNGSDCSDGDSRLYDSNVGFVLGCWRWYCWTGDEEFLAQAMPTVRRATDYLVDAMGGRGGLLTIPGEEHTGVCDDAATSRASSYFDCIPAGHQDAYTNAYFAQALTAAAELEEASGEGGRAGELRALVPMARRAYNAAFWDDEAGRYISWIDAKGGRHDYGMTYVNTIAATYGLASAEQVRAMFRWMTEEPTASGEADTFSRWVFAPRSNTMHCDEQFNRLAYDEWCEDGGAILWTAFYEIMARAKHLGANDAWARFEQIVDRANEADRLMGGSPFLHGEVNNHGGGPGSVGTWGEFPESGLAPCAFLYGFIGVEPTLDGLRITPRLPAHLEHVGVDGLVWRGQRLKLTAYRDRVRVEGEGGASELPLNEGTCLFVGAEAA